VASQALHCWLAAELQVGVAAQWSMAAHVAQVRSLVVVQAAVSYCEALQVVQAVQTRSLVALQAAVSCVPVPQLEQAVQVVPLPV
jgi:hypothetical protein